MYQPIRKAITMCMVYAHVFGIVTFYSIQFSDIAQRYECRFERVDRFHRWQSEMGTLEKGNSGNLCMKAYYLASNVSWVVSCLETFTEWAFGSQLDAKCVVWSLGHNDKVLSGCNKKKHTHNIIKANVKKGKENNLGIKIVSQRGANCVTRASEDPKVVTHDFLGLGPPHDTLACSQSFKSHTILLFLLVEWPGHQSYLGFCLLEQHEWAAAETYTSGSHSLPLIQLPTKQTNDAIVASQVEDMKNAMV